MWQSAPAFRLRRESESVCRQSWRHRASPSPLHPRRPGPSMPDILPAADSISAAPPVALVDRWGPACPHRPSHESPRTASSPLQPPASLPRLFPRASDPLPPCLTGPAASWDRNSPVRRHPSCSATRRNRRCCGRCRPDCSTRSWKSDRTCDRGIGRNWLSERVPIG